MNKRAENSFSKYSHENIFVFSRKEHRVTVIVVADMWIKLDI
jgi:hypothetical protein